MLDTLSIIGCDHIFIPISSSACMNREKRVEKKNMNVIHGTFVARTWTYTNTHARWAMIDDHKLEFVYQIGWNMLKYSKQTNALKAAL